MSSTAIQIEHLSKMYRLGVINNGTLFRDIQTWIALKRGKEDPHSKIGENKYSGDKDHFWALKDVSFEIKQGDRVGIIGKNGAGKSTLLKILSRITTPTEGTIKIKGKVASLLEVGTGFHGELTGIEYIYLNGAILGMRKRRIDDKLDEIIAFSGIEQHIDTPVKRYSSGMYVRLAFAVAAHLDSDILIADEVLAVGDADFQKKALGKMQDLSTNEGRTVLFVSHNMQSITALTEKSILINEGYLIMHDKTNTVIQKYLSVNTGVSVYENHNISMEHPTITKVYCNTSHNGNIQQYGEKIEFVIEIDNPFPIESAAVSYQIINSNNIPVIHILVMNEEINFCNEKGKYILKSIIPKLKLFPDKYRMVVHFANKVTKQKYETLTDIVLFEVKVFGELRDYYWQPNTAIYVEENQWNIRKI